MKCSCAAEHSFSSEARHFAMNSAGVNVGSSMAWEDPGRRPVSALNRGTLQAACFHYLSSG